MKKIDPDAADKHAKKFEGFFQKKDTNSMSITDGDAELITDAP